MSTPTFPQIFDKCRLNTNEFKRYIYEIPFKIKGGGTKISRGMTAAGHIHAAHPYLKSIKSEILNYGTVGARNILSCVVRVTVTLCPDASRPDNEIVVQALADGDVTSVPSADTLVRTVETRAINRAFERLLDLSKSDLNDDIEAVDEEEHGTQLPRTTGRQSLTQMMDDRREKQRVERERINREEGDDNSSDTRGLSDTFEPDETANTNPSCSEEDW